MKATLDKRRLAKLAVIIHGQLSAPRNSSSGSGLPEVTWLLLRKQLHQLRLAERRQWTHAQDTLRSEVRFGLERLRDEVQALLNQLQIDTPAVPASPHEIYQDLLALHEEFCTVEWSAKQHSLSVTTEPITLKGRYLGPFRIELDIRMMMPQPFYSIVAEDPQPSSPNSDVVHPHVNGDQLCEGEGTLPIRAALRDGRVLDFFLIVSNLLHTYNSSSPYVGLNEWDGVRCKECDYGMDEDEGRGCERCEATLCDDCCRFCRECSDTCCSSCSLLCAGCEEDLCRSCAKECCDCDESFCSSCLQDDERCPACHEDFQEQAEGEHSDAALQPVCVGQADIHAGSG